MLSLQSDDVLLHIFTFVPPLTLCSSCNLVNFRWYKLIVSSAPLWISWDKYYPFLLPHIPTPQRNIKNDLLAEVMVDKKWRNGEFKEKFYSEAHKGTMLMSMSLWQDRFATSSNDHLIKLWELPSFGVKVNSYVYIYCTELFILCS